MIDAVPEQEPPGDQPILRLPFPNHITAGEQTLSDEAIATCSPLPRPSILHLMAWTAGSAVYLGICYRNPTSPFPESSSFKTLSALSACLSSIVYGAALMLSGVILNYKWHNRSWRLNPGAWMAVLLGWAITVTTIGQIALRLCAPWHDNSPAAHRVFTICAATLYVSTTGIIEFILFWRLKESLRWRLWFLFMSLGSMTQCTMLTLSWLGALYYYQRLLYLIVIFANVFVPLLLIGIIISDAIQRKKRNGFHRAGVVLMASTCGVTLVQYFIFVFLNAGI